MGKLLGRSILLTILIISVVTITTYDDLQNVNPLIKLVLFIIIGLLLIGITVSIGSVRNKGKTKSLDKSRTDKNK